MQRDNNNTNGQNKQYKNATITKTMRQWTTMNVNNGENNVNNIKQ
jgi:hypothetical protein